MKQYPSSSAKKINSKQASINEHTKMKILIVLLVLYGKINFC